MKKFFEIPSSVGQNSGESILKEAKERPQDSVEIGYVLSDSPEELLALHQRGLDELDGEEKEMLQFLEEYVSEGSDVNEILEKTNSFEGGLVEADIIDLAVAMSGHIEDVSVADARQREMLRTRQANELSDSIENVLYDSVDDRKRLKEMERVDFRRAISELAKTEARVNVFNQSELNVIDFSNNGNAKMELTRLEVVLARAKNDLRNIAAEHPDFLPQGQDFFSWLKEIQEGNELFFMEGDKKLEKNHRLLVKMRHKLNSLQMFIKKDFDFYSLDSEDENVWH